MTEALNTTSFAVSTETRPPLRVLVVDDDVEAATALSYSLQVLGCQTAVAYGSSMAVQLGGLFKPALVLVDLELAGESGCDVVPPLRSLDGSSQALFVCLADREDADWERRALDAGFDRFVARLIDPLLLNEILKAADERAALLAAVVVAQAAGASKFE